MEACAPMSWMSVCPLGWEICWNKSSRFTIPCFPEFFPFFKILIETYLKRSSTECEQVTDISGLRGDRDCCHGLAHLRQIRQKMPNEFQKSIPVTKELLLVLLSSVQYPGMPRLATSIVSLCGTWWS